jgi:hypothetical protein
MKIIIEHKKTKREINGAFAFCCDKKDLEQLKQIIDQKLKEDFIYGWIGVDEQIDDMEENDFVIIKRQKSIANS